MLCEVCQQPFSLENEPYLLYCGHSICCNDLDSFKLSNSAFQGTSSLKFPCPICSEIIDCVYYENDLPPINQHLMEYLEEVNQTSYTDINSSSNLGSTLYLSYENVTSPDHPPKAQVLCQNCSTTVSSCYCTVCGFDLCLQCDHLIHSNKVFASHRRTPKGLSDTYNSQLEANSTLSVSNGRNSSIQLPFVEFCSCHPAEILKFYCLEKSCSEIPFLCAYCVIEPQHRQHSVVAIDQAFTKLKNDLISKEAAEADQLITQLGNLQLTAQQTQQHNLNMTEINQTNVLHDFELIRQLLIALEKKLINHIKKEYEDSESDIIKTKVLLANYYQELYYAKQRLQLFLDSSDPLNFLKERKKTIDWIKEINRRVTSFLEQSVVPSVQTTYDCSQFVLSPELQSLLSNSSTKSLLGEKIDRDSASPIDFIEETWVLRQAERKDETTTSLSIVPSATVVVGNIAHSFLNTLDQIERNIPFCPRLVVSGVVTLDAKEVHLFSSITVKPQGVLTVATWDAINANTGLLYLIVQGCVLVEPDGEINLVGKGYQGGQGSNQLEIPSEAGEPCDEGHGGRGGHGSQFFGTIGGGGGGYMTAGKPAKPNTYKDQCNFGGYGGIELTVDPSDTVYESYMRMGSGGGNRIGLNLNFLLINMLQVEVRDTEI